MALYLNLLQMHAFPKWPEVFAVAEQAMARLQATDGELYDHLQECAVKNVKLDPKVREASTGCVNSTLH